MNGWKLGYNNRLVFYGIFNIFPFVLVVGTLLLYGFSGLLNDSVNIRVEKTVFADFALEVIENCTKSFIELIEILLYAFFCLFQYFDELFGIVEVLPS